MALMDPKVVNQKADAGLSRRRPVASANSVLILCVCLHSVRSFSGSWVAVAKMLVGFDLFFAGLTLKISGGQSDCLQTVDCAPARCILLLGLKQLLTAYVSIRPVQ